MASAQEERVPETLDKSIEHLEEEARMVLPGIQALFGFQLVAVFNQRFEALSRSLQLLHLLALCATAIATMLVLLPAAYHRQAEPETISKFLCRLGTRSLTVSLLVLAAAICLDLQVIAQMVLGSPGRAAALSGGLFAALLGAWFVYPQLKKHSSKR